MYKFNLGDIVMWPTHNILDDGEVMYEMLAGVGTITGFDDSGDGRDFEVDNFHYPMNNKISLVKTGEDVLTSSSEVTEKPAVEISAADIGKRITVPMKSGYEITGILTKFISYRSGIDNTEVSIEARIEGMTYMDLIDIEGTIRYDNA